MDHRSCAQRKIILLKPTVKFENKFVKLVTDPFVSFTKRPATVWKFIVELTDCQKSMLNFEILFYLFHAIYTCNV